MSLGQKFEEAKQWIIVAIVEKLEGRIPNNTELYTHVSAIHHTTGVSEFFWKKRKILECGVNAGVNEEGLSYIGGYFNIPEKLNDEWITQKTREWMK